MLLSTYMISDAVEHRHELTSKSDSENAKGLTREGTKDNTLLLL